LSKKMKILKEYIEVCPGVVRCDVRTNDGRDSFQHVTDLFNAAAADFPGLMAEDVKVVTYGSNIGITFTTDQPPPPEYSRKHRMRGAMNFLRSKS
jgi:hypothetical protein